MFLGAHTSKRPTRPKRSVLHAGCLEKPILASTDKICARPGYELEPVDMEDVKAFESCTSGVQDHSCGDVIVRYMRATGCGNSCIEAALDPRASTCREVPNGQRAQCLSTSTSACPNYPPVSADVSHAAKADALPPGSSSTPSPLPVTDKPQDPGAPSEAPGKAFAANMGTPGDSGRPPSLPVPVDSALATKLGTAMAATIAAFLLAC